MLEQLATQVFWIGLLKIIGVNIVLSGDNAVVMRIVLTVFAVALLALPWLKIVGGLLLFWIGIKLLVPEDGGDNISASDNLMTAIRTILIADLVMSVDNVIAVAAAAGGSMTLLILGLAISIPLVVFGATLLVHLMERYPVIITIGAALIGLVAGEMLVTDPALKDWLAAAGVDFDAEGKPRVAALSLEIISGVLGALIVVVAGTWLAKRKQLDEPVRMETEQPKS